MLRPRAGVSHRCLPYPDQCAGPPDPGPAGEVRGARARQGTPDRAAGAPRRAFLAAGISLSFLSTAQAAESDPASFVLSLSRDIDIQLAPGTIDPAERKRRFGILFDERLDLPAIGERVLGWRWSRATADERRSFGQALRAYLIQGFSSRVRGTDGGGAVVSAVTDEGPTVVVVTRPGTGAGPAMSLAWRLVRGGVGWRLCDVAVNDVSVTAILRSQFESILQESAPDIGPLVRLLRERSKE